MPIHFDLGDVANVCAILTALLAMFGYGLYRWERLSKRRKLESYLMAEKQKGKDDGQRSLLHLMAKVGLTEAELIQASFSSKHIARRIAANDKNNRAEALLLEYV